MKERDPEPFRCIAGTAWSTRCQRGRAIWAFGVCYSHATRSQKAAIRRQTQAHRLFDIIQGRIPQVTEPRGIEDDRVLAQTIGVRRLNRAYRGHAVVRNDNAVRALAQAVFAEPGL